MKRIVIGGTVLALLLLWMSGCTATYGPDWYGDGGYYGPEWDGSLIVGDGGYYHGDHWNHGHPPVFYPGGGHAAGGWGGNRGRASLGARAGHGGFGGHPAGGGHAVGGGHGGGGGHR